MTKPIEPVAWLRDQRGEYEGAATLDTLFSLGAKPPFSRHLATYSPLYDETALQAARAEGRRQGLEEAAKAEACADSAYAAGMLLGWNLCTQDQQERFNHIREQRMRAAASAAKSLTAKSLIEKDGKQ